MSSTLLCLFVHDSFAEGNINHFENQSKPTPLNIQQTSIRKPIEDWALSQQKISNQKDWVKWVQKKQQEVDHWIAISDQKEKHDHAVGWGHDYVDAHGKWIYWTPDKPIPLNASEKVAAAWLLKVRIYNIERMVDAAYLYRLTHDKKYQQWAVAQMNAYAVAYNKIPLQTWNGNSRLFNQALDEAIYSFQLIEVMRLLKPELSESIFNYWKDNLLIPMAGNLLSSSKNNSNIAVWIAASVNLIGQMIEDTALMSESMDSAKGLSTLLSIGVTEDGFWHEDSLQYQDYVVLALYQWLYATSLINPSNVNESIGLQTKKMMLSSMRLRFPNGQSPMLNDSQGLKWIPNKTLWQEVARIFPTKEGIESSLIEKNWNALIDPIFEKTGNLDTDKIPQWKSGVIEGLKLVTLQKDKQWAYLLRYGQHSIAHHTHQEVLTADLQYDGTWVFRDQGTVAYGSSMHRNYYKQAPAHTGVLIDQKGQIPWPSSAQLVEFNEGNSFIHVHHPNFQKNKAVSKKVSVLDQQWVDETSFQLDEEKSVGLSFQTGCQIKEINGKTLKADALLNTTNSNFDSDFVPNGALPEKGAFSYWTDRHYHQVDKKVDIQLLCDQKLFMMTLEGEALDYIVFAKTPKANAADPVKSYQGMYYQGIYLQTKPIKESSIKTMIKHF